MAPDRKHLDDPLDTSDELIVEAAALEARAAQRRQDSIEEVHRTMTPMAIEHNAESRAVKVAEHEASLAHADAKESRGKAVGAVDDAAELTAKADSLEAAGDIAAAAELREEAAGAIEFAQRQTVQAAASEAAADAADEQAKVHEARDQALLDTAPQHVERGGAEEKAADQMEQSAVLMRNAAAQMAEAERLDAAAVDLRSRGVEGVERVDAAAKVARDEAEVLTLRAKQQDPSDTLGTEDLSVDPNLIEIEPNTPESPEQPSATDDLGIDPDLIEIEPNAATDDAAGAGFGGEFDGSGDGSGDGTGTADDFADTGFEQPSAATEDFGTEAFDGDSGGGASDFADSDATAGDGFGSDGGEGFEADFEA